ncbi:MAG: murein L,D-transpeptidase family protein [Hyphomicrobium sp.]
MFDRNAKMVLAASAWLALVTPAVALTIELKDVAADRVERQRAAAAGALPLPGTPDIAMFNDRLRETGVSLLSPIVLRVFKAESELEVWKEKDGAFVLFATYPICHWSGSLGPKLREGDKQTPEGYYTLTRQQTRHVGRWPRSLDIGFPNVLDQSLARTGSLILVHGGCSSVGCFAMTNPVMDEIHQLTTAAIAAGQDHVPVHVFPFRMTEKNMTANAQSPWASFWANLKEGYDLFEKTKRPPVVGICDGRYHFEQPTSTWGSGPLQACGQTLMAIKDQDKWLQDVPQPSSASPRHYEDVDEPEIPDEPDAPGVETRLSRDKQTMLRKASARTKHVGLRCSLKLASCRKFAGLTVRASAKRRLVALSGQQGRPRKSQRRG